MLKVIKKKEVINEEFNPRLVMIQQLIPLGLEAVREALEEEVVKLAGAKHSRKDGANVRWGSNPGSVYLGEQKVAVKVPRVRNKVTGEEVSLSSYEQLKDSGTFDNHVFNHVINGIANRNYEKAAELVPETFGIKKSSVSRKFKEVSAKKLKEFFSRDLGSDDFIVIFIDGKHFRDNQMIIALGVTMEGKKVPLSFIESSSENATVCGDLLRGLVDRNLKVDNEILFVIDGAKGMHKAVKDVFGSKAVVQRCQWHKRENVLSYLPKKLRDDFKKKLLKAHHQPNYKTAKSCLAAIRKELQLVNEDAAKSLDEGLEETLTLQRLGVFEDIGKSLRTTNCIENLNRGVSRLTGRVTKWTSSDHRRRWLACALIELETGFAKVEGYKQFPLLRDAMRKLNGTKEVTDSLEIKTAA